MLFGRKLITALSLTAALTAGVSSTSVMADEAHGIEAYTDMIVESAVYDVKQNLSLGVTYDVLTASHRFEPEMDDNNTLVAEITITPIKADALDDNDA